MKLKKALSGTAIVFALSMVTIGTAHAVPWERATVSGWDTYTSGYIREFPNLI